MTLAAGAGSLLRSARVFSEVLGLPPHTFPPAHISSRLPSNLGCKQVIHKYIYVHIYTCVWAETHLRQSYRSCRCPFPASNNIIFLSPFLPGAPQRRGFSPDAAARHPLSAAVHTDLFLFCVSNFFELFSVLSSFLFFLFFSFDKSRGGEM